MAPKPTATAAVATPTIITITVAATTANTANTTPTIRSTAITEVFLFYKDTEAGLGCLHWCDPSKGRQEVAGNSLNLAQIREMTAGKQVAAPPPLGVPCQRTHRRPGFCILHHSIRHHNQA